MGRCAFLQVFYPQAFYSELNFIYSCDLFWFIPLLGGE